MFKTLLGRVLRPILPHVLLPVLLCCAGAVQAGSVTLYENQLDAIFGVAGLGIDIRIDAARTIVHPDWTVLNQAEFNTMAGYSYAHSTLGVAAKAVPVFFIDSFDPSLGGAPTSGVIGLGWVGLGGLAVNSYVAGNAVYGSTVVAHELGHNLGLSHGGIHGDLMYPNLDASGSATHFESYEISTILRSSLVQVDALGQKYIEIAPFAVVAALPVPEPASWAMLLGGLGLIGAMRRRNAR
ncbi:PEPxxWA-CTERM sorting domain-containing protein [Oxalobacteraceae bacterium A2-2]